MTAHKDPMSEQPWQPGPWTIGNHGVIDAEGKPVHRDPCGPNVKLEVLAPEMAAAIMEWVTKWRGCGRLHGDCGCALCRKLVSLDDKLRGIGGKA